MLDFTKVFKQIQEVGIDSVNEASQQDVMERALVTLESAAEEDDRFTRRLEDSAGWVWWPLAIPMEPFGVNVKIQKAPAKVTTIGVDGSQIMPSHHEVHSCYLLNVGVAMISYGEAFPSVLVSVPRLHHRPDDLYPLVDRRRVHIDELFVSLERTVLELEVLAENALIAQERGLPVVALYDGSLIPWSVDKMPQGYQDSFLVRIQTCMRMLQTAGIPLVGYISHSRSSEVVNMLRTYACPYDMSNCREYCSSLNEEDFPCSKIWPLTDRQLLTHKLQNGYRSSFCLTAQNISKMFEPDNQICFSYLNLVSEVARIECPKWLVENEALREFAMSVVASQVEKGRGYPVALSEAHNLAVIRAKDREQFFELIKKHLIALGMKKVRVSPKESKKRIGFV
ncbi:MAG: DNA double-strand break repair nuclease NurA [Candidatus Melainabacteria bacterium]|nr:DNA double-strand break repair nuclease NurA [Candidatus Melainabacteria bacterium]